MMYSKYIEYPKGYKRLFHKHVMQTGYRFIVPMQYKRKTMQQVRLANLREYQTCLGKNRIFPPFNRQGVR